MKKSVKKISRGKNIMSNSLTKLKEENELLKLQLMAREKEKDEYKKELDEIHKSISYIVGRQIAETRTGSQLKKILKKHIRK